MIFAYKLVCRPPSPSSVSAKKKAEACDGGFESGEPGLHAREINCDLAKTTAPDSDAADTTDAGEEDEDVVE